MAGKNRGIKSKSITQQRRDRSDIVFRFKLFGRSFLVRPPRLVYLGKTLAAAVPAILALSATAHGLIEHGSISSLSSSEASYRQSMAQLQNSDPKSKADLVFARLLAMTASDYRVWDRFMDYLLATDQRKRLQQVLKGLAPDESKGNPNYHLRLANLLLTEFDPSGRSILAADRHLRFAAELDAGPTGILARRKLALLSINRGELASAFKILEPVMTENPVAGAEALWLAWSGSLPFDPNAPDRVLEKLERDLRAQRIPDAENVLAKMRILVMQNQAEEALEWLALQKTLDQAARSVIESEVAEMQVIASMRSSEQGNLPDWSKLERILNLKPNDPIWLNLVVDIWSKPLRVGSEAARRWVQTKLDDGTANDILLRQALVVLSDKYEAEGKTAEDSKPVRSLYRQYLKRFPEDPVALNNLAVLLYKHEPESLEEALRLARNADERMPNQPSIQETIGQILARIGRLDESQAILESCLGALPDDWGLHNTLVQIYEKSGNSKLAEAHRAILSKLARPIDAVSYENIVAKKKAEVGSNP